MNTAAWSLASSVLGVIVGLLALVAFAWKLGKPHIEKWLTGLAVSMNEQSTQLVEIHRVVSENGHKNPSKPSLPDRIASMEIRLDRRLTDQDKAIARQEGKLDKHLAWSETETTNIWAAIGRKK